MRTASMNMSVFTNPRTDAFVALFTGSEFCAEHEGDSNAVFNAFGSRHQITVEELRSNNFDKDSFITSIEDYRVKNQELLVLVNLQLPVPDKLRSELYPAVKAEIAELKQALKAMKTPFVCPQGHTVELTALVTAKDMFRKPYIADHAVKCYNESAGTSITTEQFVGAINAAMDQLDPGIIRIKDVAMSQIVMRMLQTSEHMLEYLRDLLFFQHVKAHGLNAPELEKRVFSVIPDSIRKQDWSQTGYIRCKYYSMWRSPLGAGDDFHMFFGSIDPKVGAALENLFEVYRSGNLCVSMDQFGIHVGGSGVRLYNLAEVSEETKARIAQEHVAYQEAMLNLKAQNFFINFDAKKEALSKVVKLSLTAIHPDKSFICATEPKDFGKYIGSTYVPNEVLMAWFNNEIADVDMIAQYFS